MMEVEKKMKFKFDEVWCAIGSGTLAESIILGTNDAKVFGVQVGAEYKKSKAISNNYDRLKVLKYHKSFDKVSKYKAPFKSTPNYDLKAFEYCMLHQKNKIPKTKVLFWNVL